LAQPAEHFSLPPVYMPQACSELRLFYFLLLAFLLFTFYFLLELVLASQKTASAFHFHFSFYPVRIRNLIIFDQTDRFLF
jgi:hypothetical protein